MNGMWAVALVVAAVSIAVSLALRLPPAGDSLSSCLGLTVPYVILAALAGFELRRRQRLQPLLRFRPGDPSIGVGLAVLLLVGAWLTSTVLLPLDAVQHAWVLRVLLLFSDTSSAFVTSCLLLLAVCEELVWRGWVQTQLAERFGVRKGWVVGAALYAAAYLPTLATLGDAAAGPNPLLVLTGLGTGLCWAFLRERTGRLMPGLFSHVAFTYFATQYLWRMV